MSHISFSYSISTSKIHEVLSEIYTSEIAAIESDPDTDITQVCCERLWNFREFQKKIKNIYCCLQFSCDICKSKFTLEKNLLAHKKSIHSAIRKFYKCSLCNKTYANKYVFQEHLRKSHAGEEVKLDECQNTIKNTRAGDKFSILKIFQFLIQKKIQFQFII